MSELPEGWITAPLAELVGKGGEFADGDWIESKDQDANGSIRLLQLADVGDGIFIDKSHRFINESTFDRLRCTEVLEGDVLIARMPDPLGRACLAPRLSQRCITVVDVAIFRSGMDSVTPRWTMHFLNAPQIRAWIELESSGTTRKRIARGKLAEMEFPVPPLPEQKRIADKLEAVLGRVDACRVRLARVPDLLKRFRQSVLSAATSGRLTADWRVREKITEWSDTTIGNITQSSFYGPRFSKDDYTNALDGIPTVRTTDMTKDGRINISADTPRVVVPANRIEQFRAQKGDLLITRTGSIGIMALMELDIVAIPSAYLIRFRFNDRVLPRYAFYCLSSPYGQECLGLSTTAVAQPNINAEAIKQIEIELPSLAEQQEILNRVEVLFAFADRIEARLKEAQTTVDRLTPSTLAKAFRGELVPQDPNDEPASFLLERIRIQRRAETNKPRQKPLRSVPKMKKLTIEALKQVILKHPRNEFDFDDLSRVVKADYDQLSEMLISLLGEPTPILRQEFDKKAKKMRFVRIAR